MSVSGMMPAMKSLILLCLAATVAYAAPAKPAKKYHFELTKVLVKPEVKADVGTTAQPRVEAAIKKAFASNPQLIATLEGAPDPEVDHGQPYRKYLAKKGIDSAYLVTVEVTEASEELVPMEDKKNTQRLVVHVGIHVLGETIPGRTMGFTGDGQATVKQEVGMKVRDKDRTYAWDGAAETAVDDALKTCFAQLAKPKVKQ
jgi:lipoprotein-anchoring transpeptidase ErfK/SrfK